MTELDFILPEEHTPEMIADIARRLRGSRLAAGYLVMRDVYAPIGVKESNYRRMEAGEIPVNETLLSQVSDVYGVSPRFLHGEEPQNQNEILALRLTEILIAAPERDPTRPERLRNMRSIAGYANPSQASKAHLWPLATYNGHENATNEILLDRMIGYALSFRLRPEYAAQNTGTPKPSPSEDTSWWFDRRGPEAAAESNAGAWRWLQSTSTLKKAEFRLIEISGDRFVLADAQSMVLPRFLLESVKAEADGALFGFVSKGEGSVSIYALSPKVSGAKAVFVSGDGTVEVIPSKETIEVQDPLLAGPIGKDKICLGGLVAKVEVHNS